MQRFVWLFFVGVAAAAGCQGGSTSAPKASLPATPVRPFAGNAIEALDPCGDHMQDLCGALLSYVLVNKHVPMRLEELTPFADAGQVLQFTCPVSGKPYVYAPSGLRSPSEGTEIYIYDAEPVHSGARWCAVRRTASVTGAETFFSELIPEARFSQFSATPAVQVYGK